MKIQITFGLLLSLLAGCANEKLPRYSLLQGLRVMALVSDQPEINYNGAVFSPTTVNITPVVSDVYGAGRALEANIYWCLDLGISAGVNPSCDSNPSKVTLATAQSVAATATFVAPNYTGSLTPFAVDFSAGGSTALAAVASAYQNKSTAQKYNGFSLLVFYEIYPASAPSEKVTAFKRIVLSDSSKATKNANPTGLEIRLNGTEITSSLPTTETELEAYLPSTSAESYSFFTEQSLLISQTENIETTWFFTAPADIECSRKEECNTDGIFFLSRSRPGELNRFTPPTAALPTTRGRVLVAVARDDRGGQMVKRYCVGSGGLCP